MIEVLISDWGWVVLKLKLEAYRVISSCETERKPVVNLKERDKETNAGVGDRKVLVALEGGRLCVSPSTAARPLVLWLIT